MVFHIPAVDLRNDQRHIGVHSKRGTVVDDDRALLRRHGRERATDIATRGDEHEVNFTEQLRRRHFDRNLFTHALQLLADRALRGAQADIRYGEIAFFEHIQKDAPHRARCANYCDTASVHYDLNLQ